MKIIRYCCLLLTVYCILSYSLGENWIYRYNGPENGFDEAYSIVYDEDGNLYVAGVSYVTSTNSDIIVISLSTAGDTNWTRQYGGPSEDQGYSLVYGLDNNIYVTGYYTSILSHSEYIDVISLTTAGDTNWTYQYQGGMTGSNRGTSIIFGADSNLYIAGYQNECYPQFPRWGVVISLTTAGNRNWVYSPGPYGDIQSIVCGFDGNIYTAGCRTYYISQSGWYWDFQVISLTNAGNVNWSYSYEPWANNWDMAKSIDCCNLAGNICAAGYISGCFAVVNLNTAGDTNWVYLISGIANSIIRCDDGNLYVGGAIGGDFAVISLTSAGHRNWRYWYNGPGTGADEAYSVIKGIDGNIYAVGYSTGIGTDRDITVISLPPDLGVLENNASVAQSNFDASIIAGPLLLPTDKPCRVFDITGRMVMPEKIKPGIYFIAVDGQIVQKIIKVR